MMTFSTRMRGLAAGLAVVALAGSAQAQQARPAREQPAQQPEGVTSGDLARAGQARGIPGPLDSPRDVQDTLKLVFMIADANNDGLISKDEAVGAGNTVIGGFFFRSDANGDGKVTQEEAEQVRQEMLRKAPVARILIQEARRTAETDQQNPFRGVANLLDVNNDQAIQASEVRQAVQTGVDGLYAAADTNRDSQMSPAELNAAAIGMAQAAAEAAFKAADEDNNGAISQAEFEKAIVEPARVVFASIDANNDGQITGEEAQRAQQFLASQVQLKIPDARGTDAPIPNFTTPTAPGGNQPQPQPGAAPGTPPRR
jgi:Ca2+-binding EF-hand superfamily protein